FAFRSSRVVVVSGAGTDHASASGVSLCQKPGKAVKAPGSFPPPRPRAKHYRKPCAYSFEPAIAGSVAELRFRPRLRGGPRNKDSTEHRALAVGRRASGSLCGRRLRFILAWADVSSRPPRLRGWARRDRAH